MFKKILVGVDGSRQSNRAVEAAAELAQRYEASVWLLHVIRNLSLPPEILDMIARGEVTASRMELLQDSAEIILENAREKFTQAGVSDVTTEYRIGNPAATLVAYAEEKGVNLIIIGKRGISSDVDMLGGVARKLVNITPISCLIVGQ